ncbi:MAG TPA: hypothetical protein VFM43_01485 [Gaiellaceae bacterium]|nr:hypothetical protein [Gaiellaceae bacterium]
MGSRSATELLLLPVRLQGIRLGRPVDLLLDPRTWRVVGFVVLCGDDSQRFLVFAAAEPREDEIDVRSALLLLEDVEFYRGRSQSFRALLGGAVVNGRSELGELRDLLLDPDGSVAALLVDQGGAIRELEPVGMRVEAGQVSTA